MASTPRPAAPDVLVFVPTFNDHSVAVDLAQRVARFPQCRSLVIDDGSAAPIVAAAVPAGTLVVRLPANFGLGVGTHVAFDHALTAGYRAVIRLDGDGQHRVEDLPRLLAALDAGDVDVAVGERSNHATTSSARNLVKVYFSAVARFVTRGRAPADVNSGFIAFSRNAVAALNRSTFERYPEPQLLITACRLGLRLKGVPVEQEERRDGRTTLGLFPALRMFYRFNVFVLGELLRGRAR